MHEHVDLLSLDDDAINGKIERDFLELFEILSDVELHSLQRIDGKHERLKRGEILANIGLA
jgi:hypothetical protein